MNKLRGHVELELPAGKTQVLLNLNALRLASQDLGVELNELLNQADSSALEALPRIYYAGYKNYCYLKGADVKYQFEQFAAQLGTLDFEELTNDLLEATGAKDETLGNGTGAKTPAR
jgi:hypothetical protein